MANRNVWVLVEAEDKKIKGTSIGLMAEGERLSAQFESELHAVLFGHPIEAIDRIMGSHGVDHLHFFSDESLRQYSPMRFERLLVELLLKHEPSLFLAAASSLGSDLMPRVAAKLRAPLVTNCVEINSQRDVEFIKPVRNGRLHATFLCRGTGPKMATLHPGVLTAAEERKIAKIARVTEIKPEAEEGAPPIRVTGFLKADHRTIDISEAEVLVAVGRGVGSKENFKKVEEFADLLQAAIGGTRPMVDAGILPFERQVGQTGKAVFPKLVLLCGISGAAEFSKGVEGAGTKVAINLDRQAPIFKSVDLGVVDDLNRFIPQMMTRIEKERQIKETK
jgi:electron transfer flavoprotein alpha subunit